MGIEIIKDFLEENIETSEHARGLIVFLVVIMGLMEHGVIGGLVLGVSLQRCITLR